MLAEPHGLLELLALLHLILEDARDITRAHTSFGDRLCKRRQSETGLGILKNAMSENATKVSTTGGRLAITLPQRSSRMKQQRMEKPSAQWWYADVSAWQPGSADWDRAMSLLPAREQQKVTRFLFAKDQRLALGSRVLQRRLIHSLFNAPIQQIDIQRTPEGKPFWKRNNVQQQQQNASESHRSLHAPPESWNYNVSHHGTIVAIASHPQRLVGVDVVQITERPNAKTTSVDDFFRAFESHFNISEWAYIRNISSSSDEDCQFVRFYRLWSLKEAYIKAIGIGLGFALLRAEFFFSDAHQQWQLRLDGRLASEWRFESTQLDAVHIASLAHGPLDAMWSPATSSIFSSPSVAFTDTSDDGDDRVGLSVEPASCRWERKELADLIAS